MFRVRFKASLLQIFVISLCIYAQPEFPLQQGSVVALIEGDRAKELLMSEDEYTAVLSKFDLSSKTQKTDSAALNDYLHFASVQVVNWQEDEKKIMGEIVESVNGKISALGLNIKLPEKIEVIKSTMKEEGGASGYTRGNYIVIKDKLASSKSRSLEDLFMHELFHLISRNNPDLREKIYNSLGFKKSNDVMYPAEIADLRISNPDAPHNNYFITVEYESKPFDVMIILFSPKPYNGGSFFSYMQIGLLAIEGGEMNKSPIYKEGKPLILKVKEVKNFYKQIGKNSDYILHAEELSADHFVMMLNQETELPNPELIEAMKNAMK